MTIQVLFRTLIGLILVASVMALCPACSSRIGRDQDDDEVRAPNTTAADKDLSKQAENTTTIPSTVMLSLERQALIGLKVEPVKVGPLKTHLPLTGEIALNEDRLARISSAVSGIINEVFKTLGDHVEKGDILAIVESRELAEAKAEYLMAKATLTVSEKAYAREKRLYEKKISPEQDYLGAQKEREEAQIAVQLARQKLMAVGLTETDLASIGRQPDSASGLYSIRAPLTGWIVKKDIALGDKVAESPLYTICDLSTVWIAARAYAENVASIQLGQNALVTSKAHLARIFEGEVVWIAPSVSEESRTLEVRLSVANPDLALKAGMFVDVNLVIGERPDVLQVPESAIIADNMQAYVFVVGTGGITFSKREVSVGVPSMGQIEIRSGLHADEHIVTDGAFTLDSELKKGSFADED